MGVSSASVGASATVLTAYDQTVRGELESSSLPAGPSALGPALSSWMPCNALKLDPAVQGCLTEPAHTGWSSDPLQGVPGAALEPLVRHEAHSFRAEPYTFAMRCDTALRHADALLTETSYATRCDAALTLAHSLTSLTASAQPGQLPLSPQPGSPPNSPTVSAHACDMELAAQQERLPTSADGEATDAGVFDDEVCCASSPGGGHTGPSDACYGNWDPSSSGASGVLPGADPGEGRPSALPGHSPDACPRLARGESGSPGRCGPSGAEGSLCQTDIRPRREP